MRLGLVGLGKMGGNMARRLQAGGHQVAAYDPDSNARDAVAGAGAEPAASLAQLTGKLDAPRVVWLMVPAGEITSATIDQLLTLLEPGDTIIDGGNSN
ncbi:MAG: NAD(P)-binding domain-containing protein, partial [Thermoleophilia bacterium]